MAAFVKAEKAGLGPKIDFRAAAEAVVATVKQLAHVAVRETKKACTRNFIEFSA